MNLYGQIIGRISEWRKQRKFEQGMNELTQTKNYKKLVGSMIKRLEEPDSFDITEANKIHRKYGSYGYGKRYRSWASRWAQIKLTFKIWVFMISNWSLTQRIRRQLYSIQEKEYSFYRFDTAKMKKERAKRERNRKYQRLLSISYGLSKVKKIYA